LGLCVIASALATGVAAGRAWARHDGRNPLPEIEVDAVETDWRPYAAMTGAVLFLAGFSLLWAAPWLGNAGADDVRSGTPVRGVDFLGLTILDVRAVRARVHWKEERVRPDGTDLTGCLLYVGRDTSSVLLYRAKTARTPAKLPAGLLRLPAVDVIVELTGNDACTTYDQRIASRPFEAEGGAGGPPGETAALGRQARGRGRPVHRPNTRRHG